MDLLLKDTRPLSVHHLPRGVVRSISEKTDSSVQQLPVAASVGGQGSVRGVPLWREDVGLQHVGLVGLARGGEVAVGAGHRAGDG